MTPDPGVRLGPYEVAKPQPISAIVGLGAQIADGLAKARFRRSHARGFDVLAELRTMAFPDLSAR